MAEQRRKLVIATGNTGKLREYRELLAGTGLELIAFDTEVDEVGETYEENAKLKAEAAAERSGLPALGDDSGVEVEALDGFPGIRSARLGPTQEERTAELLKRLEGKPRPWNARFVCVLALTNPGHPTRFFEGECRGRDRAGMAGSGGLWVRPGVPGSGDGQDVRGDAAGGKAAVQPSGARGRARCWSRARWSASMIEVASRAVA